MASKTDSLGDRMKDFEMRMRSYVPRRSNLMIRLDGKGFSKYTKKLAKPWDLGFMHDMVSTAEHLCKNIQGAKFAYVQSDEISVLVTDYDDIATDMWFGGQVQKVVSVTASMAAAKFNQLRYIREMELVERRMRAALVTIGLNPDSIAAVNECISIVSCKEPASFDSRVFVLPTAQEVVNAVIWRQNDATRNSILGLAQSMFSHRQMLNKSCAELQEMMFANHGVNWNEVETKYKRGVFVYCEEGDGGWRADYEMPVITADRDYVLRLIPDINLL